MANEELNSKLVEILASIQSTVGAAKDFTLAQMPDVAQSYVVYGRVSATTALVLCIAILIASIVAGIKLKEYADDEINVFFPAGIVGGVALFCFFMNLQSFLMVWFAPKVWLLKEIASLLK